MLFVFRGASVFALAVLYLLCILIIIANVTVLLVVRLDPYFHSPYGYFKASIALADLLVGKLQFIIKKVFQHSNLLYSNCNCNFIYRVA